MKDKVIQNATSKNRNRPETIIIIIIETLVIGLFIPAGIISKHYWLSVLALPVDLFINYGWAIKRKRIAWVIVCSLAASLSMAAFLLLLPESILPLRLRLSGGVISFGFGWFLIWYGAKKVYGGYWWWAGVPGSIILSLGVCILFSNLGFWDFVFYIGAGTGIGLLAWGISERLLGLIIAGSITLTTAPGIAFSFNYFSPSAVLSQIGIMLIWFAVGWGLITISSRVVYEKYLWWPLIPGGILGVVGFGLYFGGDPLIGSTLLENTSAFGLVIFAGYLILFRLRIQK